MKIKNVILARNNFWSPFIAFLTIYYFGKSAVSYLSVRTITANMQPFPTYLFFDLISLPYAIILTFVAQYVIVRRLIGEDPKKVFRIELPILIGIYSSLEALNVVAGLMLGGSKGLTWVNVLSLVGIPTGFFVVWLSGMCIYLFRNFKK